LGGDPIQKPDQPSGRDQPAQSRSPANRAPADPAPSGPYGCRSARASAFGDQPVHHARGHLRRGGPRRLEIALSFFFFSYSILRFAFHRIQGITSRAQSFAKTPVARAVGFHRFRPLYPEWSDSRGSPSRLCGAATTGLPLPVLWQWCPAPLQGIFARGRALQPRLATFGSGRAGRRILERDTAGRGLRRRSVHRLGRQRYNHVGHLSPRRSRQVRAIFHRRIRRVFGHVFGPPPRCQHTKGVTKDARSQTVPSNKNAPPRIPAHIAKASKGATFGVVCPVSVRSIEHSIETGVASAGGAHFKRARKLGLIPLQARSTVIGLVAAFMWLPGLPCPSLRLCRHGPAALAVHVCHPLRALGQISSALKAKPFLVGVQLFDHLSRRVVTSAISSIDSFAVLSVSMRSIICPDCLAIPGSPAFAMGLKARSQEASRCRRWSSFSTGAGCARHGAPWPQTDHLVLVRKPFTICVSSRKRAAALCLHFVSGDLHHPCWYQLDKIGFCLAPSSLIRILRRPRSLPPNAIKTRLSSAHSGNLLVLSSVSSLCEPLNTRVFAWRYRCSTTALGFPVATKAKNFHHFPGRHRALRHGDATRSCPLILGGFGPACR